ncbi:MAG TPA: 50S ribosomal protein L21 [bacterium]|nr:50S ribosomal protein L21 [bacterium]
MYAVIETGGKQYRIEQGTTVQVERLDAEPGTSVTLDQVVLLGDGETLEVGAPTVAGALVTATVVAHGRGRKIIVMKYKPKAHYSRKTGHRQAFTTLKIEKIELKRSAS